MNATEQEQREEQQPPPQEQEQQQQRGGAPDVGGQGAGGKKKQGAADEARDSGDQARKNALLDKVARVRFDQQKRRVAPGAYGANFDKAGLRPLRGSEIGDDKDVSKRAIAAAPPSWRDRVVGTVKSEDVAPDDPGHTYHLLDDQTVVSTSEPAVVDPKTAADAGEAVAKKPGEEQPPQVTEIVKSVQQLQIDLRHQRTRSTDLKTPESIKTDRRRAGQIRGWLEECDAAGLNHPEVRQARADLADLEKNIDSLEQEHHEAIKQLEAKKKESETEDAEGGDQPSRTDKAKKWLGDHTEAKGSLIKKEVSAGGSVFGDQAATESEGPLGSTRVSKYSALSGEAKAGVDVAIGKDGLQAEASAEAKATLVDFQERWEWRFPFELLGEETEATLYMFAKGMVGAEAKAQISANVKALSPKSPKIDENEVMAGVNAFAGAKLSLGVGAAYEWKKKAHKAYAPKLKKSARAIMDLVYIANPALGWILDQLSAEEAAVQLLDWLFEWGAQGKVPLLGIEAMGEGSAGVGVQAMAKAGIKGGKLDFMAKANATWGLGLGGQVKVMLDVVEGPKYAVICLGELMPMVKQYTREQLDKAVQAGIGFVGDIWSWLSADDKVREAVGKGVHKVADVKQRGEMIKTLMSGWCADEDEDAICDIVEVSKKRGDMWAVIIAAGGSSEIKWALDGAQDTRFRKIIGHA